MRISSVLGSFGASNNEWNNTLEKCLVNLEVCPRGTLHSSHIFQGSLHHLLADQASRSNPVNYLKDVFVCDKPRALELKMMLVNLDV